MRVINDKQPIQTSGSDLGGWDVVVSSLGRETFNPIRNILETISILPHPDKEMISLSIGDPTTFKNLSPSSVSLSAVQRSLESGDFNGYAPSSGYDVSRKAVAEHISCGGNDIGKDDVIICSGCSCSLDMCISVLADPGHNILVPRPGFPLYKTLANGLGIQTKEYNLLPEKNWEVDLDHLESLIDGNTKAILINNPSNPCGSVFDRRHLLQILDVAERNHIPIIADEIYEHFVFRGSDKKYIPLASLTTSVPILSCGGLTKRYLVPGWRLGWITIHDRNDVFKLGGVRKGLNSLSQRIIGANTIIQGALPTILKETPKEFFDNTLDTIEENAKLAFKKLSRVAGLKPVMPDGAMYMMVGMDPQAFPNFDNCLKIVEGLVMEQSVFCLPGQCFNIKDFFRIVLTVPKELLDEACNRIIEFCNAHHPVVDRITSIPKERFQMMSISSSSTLSSGEENEDEEEDEYYEPVPIHSN